MTFVLDAKLEADPDEITPGDSAMLTFQIHNPEGATTGIVTYSIADEWCLAFDRPGGPQKRFDSDPMDIRRTPTTIRRRVKIVRIRKGALPEAFVITATTTEVGGDGWIRTSDTVTL